MKVPTQKDVNEALPEVVGLIKALQEGMKPEKASRLFKGVQLNPAHLIAALTILHSVLTLLQDSHPEASEEAEEWLRIMARLSVSDEEG